MIGKIGLKIFNAVRKSYPLVTGGGTTMPKNLKFSLNNPYILEVLPENQIDKFVKFDGMDLTTVCKELDNTAGNPIVYSSKAREALKKMYSKIIIDAKNTGNIKRAAAFEPALRRVDSSNPKEVYSNLINALYNELRCSANYSTKALKTVNIDEITAKGNSLIHVKAENGWHYRLPQWRHAEKTIDRISINAMADENLIKDLDKLIGKGAIKGYYKTPDQAINWLERHDPVTIYLDEKASPDLLELIRKTCAKYVRSTDDVLAGNKFAPGFALQKSPTQTDINDILCKMETIDPSLAQAGKEFFTVGNQGLKASAGEMEAVNKLLNILNIP